VHAAITRSGIEQFGADRRPTSSDIAPRDREIEAHSLRLDARRHTSSAT
jgi:hypothetical protein